MYYGDRNRGTHQKLGVSRFVGEVVHGEGQGCSAQSVHVGDVLGHAGGDLARAWETVGGGSFDDLVSHVRSALGKDDADNSLFVLDALGDLGAFNEGDLQDVCVRS